MGAPLEGPDLGHAEALEVVEAAAVVCSDLGDAVAVVGKGEAAAHLEIGAGDGSGGIGLGEALAQGAGVALEPGAGLNGDAEVTQDAGPDARAERRVAARVVAQEADEVKVADDAGPEGEEHVVLLVVVALVEEVLGVGVGVGVGEGGDVRAAGAEVGVAVVVDGEPADVVEGADEVVDLGVDERVGEAEDGGAVGRADELAFEGDEDVDLGGVLGL